MKRILFFLLILTIGYFFYRAVLLSNYSKNLKNSENEYYQKEYIEKSFSGLLKQIIIYKKDSKKNILRIHTQLDDFSYGVICVDKSFKDFVSINDSIYKYKGGDSVYFKNRDGKIKGFKLIFCD